MSTKELKSTSASLISNWIKKHSKSRGGRLYFYNVATGVSTWTKPDELINNEVRMRALDSGSLQRPKQTSRKRKATQQNSSPEKKQKLLKDLSKKQSIISSFESNTPNKDIMPQIEQGRSEIPKNSSPHRPRAMDAQTKKSSLHRPTASAMNAQPMLESVSAKSQPDVKERTKLNPSEIKYKNKSSIKRNESKNNNAFDDDKQVKHVTTIGAFFKSQNLSIIKHTVTSSPFKVRNQCYTSQKKRKSIGGTIQNNSSELESSHHDQSQILKAKDDSVQAEYASILMEKSIKNIQDKNSQPEKRILPPKIPCPKVPPPALPPPKIPYLKVPPPAAPPPKVPPPACACILKLKRTHQDKRNDNILPHQVLSQADILPFNKYVNQTKASKPNNTRGADKLPVQNEQVSLEDGKPPSNHSSCHSDDSQHTKGPSNNHTRHAKGSINSAAIKMKEEYLEVCAHQEIENLATIGPQREEIFSSHQTYGDHLEFANLTQNTSSTFQPIPSNTQVTPNFSAPPCDPSIGQQHNVKIHAYNPYKNVGENKIVSSYTVADDHFESVNQASSNISRLEHINNYLIKTHEYQPGHYGSSFSENQASESSIDTFLKTGTFPFENQQLLEDSIEAHLVNKAQVASIGANFSDDDYMEVDEEEILCNLQDVRNQTSNILKQASGTLTEMIFNSNKNSSQTYVIDIISFPPIQAVIFVIDTNVLISNLQFFDNLLNTTIPGYGSPKLVLPWAVMQELDYLKNGKTLTNNSNQSIAKKAAAAVRLIHRHLAAPNSKLVGQTPHEASEPTNLPFHSNDDRILQCCLQIDKKYPSSMVMLVTRDINLINKAIIMGIKAASTEDFWSHFKVPRSKVTDSPQVVSTSGELDKSKALKNASHENKIESNVHKCDTPNSADPGHAVQTHTLFQQATPVIKDTANPWTSTLSTSDTTLSQSDASLSTSHSTKKEEDNTISHRLKMEESLEVAGSDFDALNKFQTVWSVIFDVKAQITDILTKGNLQENYGVAVEMLHTMLSLLISLRSDFESCLQLSPVVLNEHKFEFASLASKLNTFFERAKLSSPDPSTAVNTDQLIQHFKQGKNRSMLLTGLEQLAEFIQNYQVLSKMCA